STGDETPDQGLWKMYNGPYFHGGTMAAVQGTFGQYCQQYPDRGGERFQPKDKLRQKPADRGIRRGTRYPKGLQKSRDKNLGSGGPQLRGRFLQGACGHAAQTFGRGRRIGE